MIIEQPPLLFRILFSETVWRIHRKRRTVFLTFDDGPIPKVTPWVLDTLDHYGVKATFFLVGDNVRRHPELLEEILHRGHSVGNHTMNHLQSIKVTTRTYLRNVALADRLIGSRLFRPPHGLLRWGTARLLKNHFSLIMYDLVTRDYNQKLTGEEVLNNVKRYVRNGSIIVCPDSGIGEIKLHSARAHAIEWLKYKGYEFEAIPMQ